MKIGMSAILTNVEDSDVPPLRLQVHPLSAVAKNENDTTKFRDALLDFLNDV